MLGACVHVCVHVHVYVCVRVRACVRACVRVCVCVCTAVRAVISSSPGQAGCLRLPHRARHALFLLQVAPGNPRSSLRLPPACPSQRRGDEGRGGGGSGRGSGTPVPCTARPAPAAQRSVPAGGPRVSHCLVDGSFGDRTRLTFLV